MPNQEQLTVYGNIAETTEKLPDEILPNGWVMSEHTASSSRSLKEILNQKEVVHYGRNEKGLLEKTGLSRGTDWRYEVVASGPERCRLLFGNREITYVVREGSRYNFREIGVTISSEDFQFLEDFVIKDRDFLRELLRKGKAHYV